MIGLPYFHGTLTLQNTIIFNMTLKYKNCISLKPKMDGLSLRYFSHSVKSRVTLLSDHYRLTKKCKQQIKKSF